MSLVNDMLRDLEERRAAPAEYPQLGDMHAADETGVARRERFERLRRWLVLIAAVMLIGIPLGLFGERLLRAVKPVPVPEPQVLREEAPAPLATQMLDVLPQNDGQRFVLQLLLDRSVSYQRTDEGGSVSLRLEAVQLVGDTRSGRIEKDGRSLSWRVEQRNGSVEVLLVGLTDRVEVRDRLEPAGGLWQLWLEVPAGEVAATPEEYPQDLPIAEPVAIEERQLPEWVTRTAADAEDTAAQSARQAATAAARQQAAAAAAMPQQRPAQPPGTATRPQMRIGDHRPDALTLARQALTDRQYPRAIRELQALHQAQPNNTEVTRWLARAYLMGGETSVLLAWLPERLQARPFDAELRELLARGQLQAGDSAAAIATLQHNPPDLLRASAYHALLAALYQQVGDWAASAAAYRQLVAIRPSQATWQLGLAIALEQLDQPMQAARHYRQALQGRGLDEGAQRFASERAASLEDAR